MCKHNVGYHTDVCGRARAFSDTGCCSKKIIIIIFFDGCETATLQYGNTVWKKISVLLEIFTFVCVSVWGGGAVDVSV